MCAPVSPDDHLEQTVSAFDLAEVLDDLCNAAHAYRDLVVRIGINGDTGAQLRADGILNPGARRIALSNSWIAFLATCRNAMEHTSGTYADETDLARAQEARLDRNHRDSLRTAMRRADTAEAAERALIAQAHERGTDLLRLDAAHPYGKSAEPKVVPVSHEAGFVAPAAA